MLGKRNYVPPRPYLDDFFEFEEDCDEDWYDDGPTSCRDIISSWDYRMYHSD